MSTSNPSPRLSPVQVARLVVVFGVLAGVGELALFAWDKLVAGKLLFTSRDAIWMTPLANMLYGAVVAGVLVLAGGGRAHARAVVFALTALAVMAWCTMFAWLYWIAVLAIGVGAGIQAAKSAERVAAAMSRLALPAAAGWVALLAIGLLWPGWVANSATGAAPPGAPNVILITLDTVRARSLSLYGHDRPTTPQLEELAAGGVTFDRAIATAPWTLPTHSTLFTGRFPHELSASWTHALDGEHPTLAEVLSAHGYETTGFAANLNYTAFEVGLARGFGHYEDFPRSLGQVVLCSALGRWVTNSTAIREALDHHENLNRKTAADIRGAFTRWLDGHGDGPFFAFLNFYDGHQPYLPPAEWAAKFIREPVARRGFRYDTNLIEIADWAMVSKENPKQLRMEEDAYDGAIAYLDDQLGRLFDDLATRGLMDNTVVIVTADHGEQFGENDALYNHGNSLYVQTLRVPLVVHAPGIANAGARIAQTVSLRDIPATILDLAGVPPGDLPGKSLADAWRDPDAFAQRRDFVLSECQVIEGGKPREGEMKSLVVGRYHYIRNGDGTTEELYDLDQDPTEQYDRTGDPAGREAVKTFRAALEKALGGN